MSFNKIDIAFFGLFASTLVALFLTGLTLAGYATSLGFTALWNNNYVYGSQLTFLSLYIWGITFFVGKLAYKKVIEANKLVNNVEVNIEKSNAIKFFTIAYASVSSASFGFGIIGFFDHNYNQALTLFLTGAVMAMMSIILWLINPSQKQLYTTKKRFRYVFLLTGTSLVVILPTYTVIAVNYLEGASSQLILIVYSCISCLLGFISLYIASKLK